MMAIRQRTMATVTHVAHAFLSSVFRVSRTKDCGRAVCRAGAPPGRFMTISQAYAGDKL